MQTTAELLAAYTAVLDAHQGLMHKDVSAEYDRQAKALALQILEGDLSGKIPAKGQKISAEDISGIISPRPIKVAKAAKLTPLQAAAEFVSTDALRPAMCGVRLDAQIGAAVATCGHRLVVFPCTVEGESVTLNRNNFEPLKAGDKVGRSFVYDGYSEKNDRYPDYQNCIPLAGKYNPAYIITDIQQLREKLAGICRASRFVEEWTGVVTHITHEGEQFFMQPEFVAQILKAMQATGSTRLQVELSTPLRAILFRDADNLEKLALVMPIMPSGIYEQGRPSAELLNTAA